MHVSCQIAGYPIDSRRSLTIGESEHAFVFRILPNLGSKMGKCIGHVFEKRFDSGALLDEKGVLAIAPSSVYRVNPDIDPGVFATHVLYSA